MISREQTDAFFVRTDGRPMAKHEPQMMNILYIVLPMSSNI
jgi:hypothetical protein